MDDDPPRSSRERARPAPPPPPSSYSPRPSMSYHKSASSVASSSSSYPNTHVLFPDESSLLDEPDPTASSRHFKSRHSLPRNASSSSRSSFSSASASSQASSPRPHHSSTLRSNSRPSSPVQTATLKRASGPARGSVLVQNGLPSPPFTNNSEGSGGSTRFPPLASELAAYEADASPSLSRKQSEEERDEVEREIYIAEDRSRRSSVSDASVGTGRSRRSEVSSRRSSLASQHERPGRNGISNGSPMATKFSQASTITHQWHGITGWLRLSIYACAVADRQSCYIINPAQINTRSQSNGILSSKHTASSPTTSHGSRSSSRSTRLNASLASQHERQDSRNPLLASGEETERSLERRRAHRDGFLDTGEIGSSRSEEQSQPIRLQNSSTTQPNRRGTEEPVADTSRRASGNVLRSRRSNSSSSAGFSRAPSPSLSAADIETAYSRASNGGDPPSLRTRAVLNRTHTASSSISCSTSSSSSTSASEAPVRHGSDRRPSLSSTRSRTSENALSSLHAATSRVRPSSITTAISPSTSSSRPPTPSLASPSTSRLRVAPSPRTARTPLAASPSTLRHERPNSVTSSSQRLPISGGLSSTALSTSSSTTTRARRAHESSQHQSTPSHDSKDLASPFASPRDAREERRRSVALEVESNRVPKENDVQVDGDARTRTTSGGRSRGRIPDAFVASTLR